MQQGRRAQHGGPGSVLRRLPRHALEELAARNVLEQVIASPLVTVDDPAAAEELAERFRAMGAAYRDLAEAFDAGADRLEDALEAMGEREREAAA